MEYNDYSFAFGFALRKTDDKGAVIFSLFFREGKRKI